MNRIFQLILGIVIAKYLVGLLMLLVYFPSHFKNFAKTYDNPGGVLNFEMSQSLGDLQMSRRFYYDSAQGKNIRETYVGLTSIEYAANHRNDTPIVRGKNGQWINARYQKYPQYLQIPISSERYVQLLWFSLATLIILIILLLYISVVLFRFAARTGRKEFFNRENRQRLRIFGAFLIAASLFEYLVPRYQTWFLEHFTDTYLGNDLRLTSYDAIGFPYALVSGLLMFIIAEAFSKGQQLQTEQEYTI